MTPPRHLGQPGAYTCCEHDRAHSELSRRGWLADEPLDEDLYLADLVLRHASHGALEITAAGAGLRKRAYRRDHRLVERPSDCAAEGDIDLGQSLDAPVNGCGELGSEERIDLADIADRVLAGTAPVASGRASELRPLGRFHVRRSPVSAESADVPSTVR